MLGDIARKSKHELELLLLFSSISCGTASAMIGDSINAMAALGQGDLILGLRIAELIVGGTWLI
jgi:hypothetical protein